MSTGTSIPRTFASRTASCAPSGARRMRRALTRFRWMKCTRAPAQGVAEGATEFHIVGGLHPDLPFDVLPRTDSRPEAALSASAPEGVHDGRGALLRAHLEAFDPRHAAGNEGSGRGFAARRRRGDFSSARAASIICDHKVSGQTWLEIARTAHEIGLRVECHHALRPRGNDEERVDHLVRLRDTQDKTQRIRDFHSAGVSSGEYRLWRTFRSRRASTI